MPCDTIQTSRVNFKMDVTDINLLKLALEALGYTVTMVGKKLTFYGRGISGSYENGEVKTSGRGVEFDVNELKRAYSKEVIKYAAKRYGWKLDITAEDEFEVQRRF